MEICHVFVFFLSSVIWLPKLVRGNITQWRRGGPDCLSSNFYLPHLLVVCQLLHFFVLQFPYLKRREDDKKSIYLIILLWGLNGLIHSKYLTHNKHWVNVSCYYFSFCLTIHDPDPLPNDCTVFCWQHREAYSDAVCEAYMNSSKAMVPYCEQQIP